MPALVTEREVGTHVIVDMYGCRKFPHKILPALERIAGMLGLKVLKTLKHRFGEDKCVGETAMVLLAESHISVHSWPERGYVSADIYSCRKLSKDVLSQAVAELVWEFGCSRYKIKVVPRGSGK